MSYIDTFVVLNDIASTLNKTQKHVNHARIAAQANQDTQLRLDRLQTRIDDRRRFVETMMADIASRN